MAESIVQSTYFRDNGITVHEFDCTTAADGSLTETNAKNADGDDIDFRGEMVTAVEYEPGSPGPTDGVADISLLTESGIDILGTDLDNVGAAVPQMLVPQVDSNNWDFPLFGTLSLKLENNAVNSAKFKIRVFFVRGTFNL